VTARALLLAFLAALLLAGPAHAHGVGTSQFHMTIEGARIEGYCDIHLTDARRVLGLDPNLAPEAGWLDLRPHEAELRALIVRAWSLKADSAGVCPIEFTSAPMEWNREQDVVHLSYVADCPSAPAHLTLHSDFMFDLDPKYRVYFSIEDARVTSVGVFRTDLRSVTIDVKQFHLWPTVFEFIREGMWHIWSGLDHMLFLLALLLPAPLLRSGGEWQPRPALWPTAREVLKVVTSFTLAHTLTLCLSFFGVLVPPAQWVETGIAISVFAAAWNNIQPFLPGRAWAMAMTFGLVHGLGFAGALKNLSMPRNAHGLALGAFNLGVEIGQILLVIPTLPLLYYASRQRWYPRAVMGVGSLAIAWMATLWVLERGFGLRFDLHK
jgi:HupE/UreJ protein